MFRLHFEILRCPATFPEYDTSSNYNTISGNRQREHLPADGGRGQQEGRKGQRGLVRSPRNGIHPKRFGRSTMKKADMFD
jgi:hypothetical protein